MDVVDLKSTAGPIFTVVLTASDLAALENGEVLAFFDPETKIEFRAAPVDTSEYVVEVGPGSFTLLEIMLSGHLTPIAGNLYQMVLPRDQGELLIRLYEVGEKTTANTTVTATTIEVVGGTPSKK